MELTATAPPAPPQKLNPSQRTYRIESIDLLRGLIMIIMALDHTRDFFHAQAFTDDPLNLNTTTPLLYFTRWITHFCAPIFVFLAGTSAYLQSLRKDKKTLSLFLIKRGLWLVFVELVIMSFAFSFDVHYTTVFLQTIWSIGISMIILGLAIWLPFTAILVLGVLIVFGHNALDFYEAEHKGSFGFFYDLLHRQTGYPFLKTHTLVILYPFLAWTGLMFLGYCFGRIFTVVKDADQRRKLLTYIGLGLIAIFVVLRAIDVYGDANHWSTQKNGLYSFLSFMNVRKYPPSLLFMCITVGPGILFLAWAGNAKSRLAKIITVYGRVPFLYYILHFYILHLLLVIIYIAQGHSFSEGWNHPIVFIKFLIPGEGFGLGVVYLIWFSVVAALYPVCKWFSEYKKTHRDWWLSYL